MKQNSFKLQYEMKILYLCDESAHLRQSHLACVWLIVSYARDYDVGARIYRINTVIRADENNSESGVGLQSRESDWRQKS